MLIPAAGILVLAGIWPTWTEDESATRALQLAAADPFLVTNLWLGDSGDPPAGEVDGDVGLAMKVSAITGLLAVGMFIGIILLFWPRLD